MSSAGRAVSLVGRADLKTQVLHALQHLGLGKGVRGRPAQTGGVKLCFCVGAESVKGSVIVGLPLILMLTRQRSKHAQLTMGPGASLELMRCHCISTTCGVTAVIVSWHDEALWLLSGRSQPVLFVRLGDSWGRCSYTERWAQKARSGAPFSVEMFGS